MGTQEGERDWVDVANNLLSKCQLTLRVRKLTDCTADVFISLYESIFGEKVPDYIAEPSSQEDDVHNIQSVIDSLSLDYLQISLSHITGENVVRGEKESIKNLLEIFDGLLEYLNEETGESQNIGELTPAQIEEESTETGRLTYTNVTEQNGTKQEGTSNSSDFQSAALVNKQSLRTSNAEEVSSSSELGLGVSARTFTDKSEETSVPVRALNAVTSPEFEATTQPDRELKTSAIPLQPPNQSDTPTSPSVDTQSARYVPTAPRLSQEPAVGDLDDTTKIFKPVADTIINGLRSPAVSSSPVRSERSASSKQRTNAEAERLKPTNGGPRRVLFRTQPDVLFLTLQEGAKPDSPSPPDTEEDEEERFGACHRNRTWSGSSTEQGALEEPLCYRRQRNIQAEEELHHISEKLSHRLEELDNMLKRVLEESGESNEVDEDDDRSRHSDGFAERGQSPRRAGAADPQSRQRTRSLSPSFPHNHHSARGQLEEAMAKALRLDDGRQTNVTLSDWADEQHLRSSYKKHRKHQATEGYEEELRRLEDKERTELHKARLKAQKAEREYREAILQDVSQAPKLSPVKTKVLHRSQTRGQRHSEVPRKAQLLKIRENDLLPVLRDELPHLHISSDTLGRMWEQQMHQVDKLHTLQTRRGRSKLSCQVEEAQRKYDLLMELTRKDQDHSRRLKDFRDRIQQQKSLQNRLKEQRQQIARAKKYHNDYHVQHRGRLMKARTKEEKMFRQLFEEGLELQKSRLREQRAFAREQRLEHQKKHQNHIESMENYYKDQFLLLAEKVAQEREEIQVRKKAQEKALQKMKRELRIRMEREIGELQKIIIQNDEDDHFQDLEVQRLRNQVHMASFHYNTNHC